MKFKEVTTHSALCLSAFFTLWLCGPAFNDAKAATDYQLVWSDEFNYTGAPDPAKWDYERGFVRNYEWQWYQEDNAVCRDGLLTITACEEHKPCPSYSEGAHNWRNNRPNIDWTSSCLITKGRKTFRFGRIEVRARIPVAPGAWPAIWFIGTADQGRWPGCGEIDLMEFYHIAGQPMLLANACWAGDKAESEVWQDTKRPLSHFSNPYWAEEFHTWRMDWDEQSLRLYVDDELLNEVPLSKTVNGKAGNYENPFLQPVYLLINLALRGEPKVWDTHALPMRLEVDYVRIYEAKH